MPIHDSAMTRRYFVESRIAGTQATLIGQEAHHLLHVMRGKPGDEVVLFDGSSADVIAVPPANVVGGEIRASLPALSATMLVCEKG